MCLMSLMALILALLNHVSRTNVNRHPNRIVYIPRSRGAGCQIDREVLLRAAPRVQAEDAIQYIYCIFIYTYMHT
jgi:hypothetical protein